MKAATIKRRLYVLCALVVFCVSNCGPAAAWMPYTHVYLAEEALKSALADGTVTIHRVNPVTGAIGAPVGTYRVDAEVLAAIRQYRGEYHAGLLGPDAYPDIPSGQLGIHADWEKGNCGGPTGNDWLSHLWQASRGPAGTNLAEKAFTIGFIQHAAGDMMAHDFINYYAGGEWEFTHHNAIKHVIIECLVARYTPASSDPAFFDVTTEHVTQFMVDQLIHTHLLAGEGCRYSVLAWVESLKALPIPLQPAIALRVEDGLRHWPALSTSLARALMFNPSRTVDYDAGDAAVKAYMDNFSTMVTDAQMVSMYKKFRSWLPRGAKGNLMWLRDFRKLKHGQLKALFQKLEHGLPEMQSLEQVLEDAEPVWDRFLPLKDPDTKYPDHGITLADFCRDQLHMAPGQRAYDYRKFHAAYNTYVISELALLGPAELRRLINDLHKLTRQPPYDGAIPENIMLGFIRSMDASHQWRPDGKTRGYPQTLLDPASFQQIFMQEHD